MQAINSKKSIVLRNPKTGSTSLEASIRFSSCLDYSIDVASRLEDANLPSVNMPEECINHFSEKQLAVRGVRNKRRAKRNYKATKSDKSVMTDTFLGLGHATLNQLASDEVSTYGLITGDIEGYDTYCVLREPLDRLLSAWKFTKGLNNNAPLSVEDFHSDIANNNLNGIVFKPQYDYFNLDGEVMRDGKRIVTPLMFSNYSNEINHLIGKLGGNPLSELPVFKQANRSKIYGGEKPSVETWITDYPEIEEKVREIYADDFELYESVLSER